MKGTVFQIQRFSVDDGPGIRTTVFLKGCPLRCIWCHNPESFSPLPQLRWHEEKCTMCGLCVHACPAGVHECADGVHVLNRERCLACGKCSCVCPSDALELFGWRTSVEEIMDEVVRDKPYYDQSGGGLTVSGGEPTRQPEFLWELLTQAKAAGVHTCLETCGFSRWKVFENLLPLVDLFLFDYKATGEEDHRKFTGVSNELILDNLNRLSQAGASILLRCPIIPGCNDNAEHFAAIRSLKHSVKGLSGVEIMPYHNIGAGKWKEIGLVYSLADLHSASEKDCAYWNNKLEED